LNVSTALPGVSLNLGALVYLDVDRNAAFDDGDTPLPDLPVTIPGTTTVGQPVSLTTTTGADGTYSKLSGGKRKCPPGTRIPGGRGRPQLRWEGLPKEG
jgi:hypothetical protein